MYQPNAFREERPEVMQALMRDHPLATLVTSATGALSADHIPMIFDHRGEHGVLRGHLARANPLFRKGQRRANLWRC